MHSVLLLFAGFGALALIVTVATAIILVVDSIVEGICDYREIRRRIEEELHAER